MDVTNPGLVNVADQAYGNPSTAVQSLAIPEDSDVLVPVADEGHPRAEDATATEDGGNSKGPTPASTNVINQPPASPSQSFGQLPGVAPAFLPFPQTEIVNTVDSQQSSQRQVQPPSFDVIGVGSTIQTNQTPDTAKTYVITAVQDANGGPVIEPAATISGSFSDVFDGGTGKLIFLTPATLPPELSSGAIVAITGSTVPSYDNSQTVLGELAIGPGSYTDASKGNPGGTVTTFSSPVPFPPSLAAGLPVTIAGANPYNGTRKVISNVAPLDGSFDEIDDAGGGQITIVSQATPLPAGLIVGRIVKLSGAYAASGAQAVSKIVNDSGTIASVSDPGGGKITVHTTAPLPVDIADGQMVTISTGSYNGTFAISGVTASTFDVATPFIATDTGAWTAYTFNLPIVFGAPAYAGSWTSYTFDMIVNFAGTASGSWTSYTFTTPGNFAGDASGKFTIYVNSPPPTSVFRLAVVPSDLLSFGVTMVGREITFSKSAPTTLANRGATRFIGGCGPGFITIDKTEFTDQRVPILATPAPGDVFTLSVQRQGGEVTTETFGSVSDVTIFPPPPLNVPNFGLPPVVPGMPSKGPIEISTGPQPGKPIITGGVQVPTAINVNVADQATSVGLPTNVYV